MYMASFNTIWSTNVDVTSTKSETQQLLSYVTAWTLLKRLQMSHAELVKRGNEKRSELCSYLSCTCTCCMQIYDKRGRGGVIKYTMLLIRKKSWNLLAYCGTFQIGLATLLVYSDSSFYPVRVLQGSKTLYFCQLNKRFKRQSWLNYY